MAATAYRLTQDTSGAAINAATGLQTSVTKALPKGSLVQVNAAQDVLGQLANNGSVAVQAPDGSTYAVPASNVVPADQADDGIAAVSATGLYVAVGVALALVGFMYWNNNRT